MIKTINPEVRTPRTKVGKFSVRTSIVVVLYYEGEIRIVFDKNNTKHQMIGYLYKWNKSA